jgi:hypothetical protein
MAKTSKKIGDNVESKKSTPTYETIPVVNNPRTESPRPSGSGQASSGTGTLDRPSETVKSKKPVPPTHKQIEDRAREIWRKKGCPIGQDEKNWLEAEAQLKKEMGIK